MYMCIKFNYINELLFSIVLLFQFATDIQYWQTNGIVKEEFKDFSLLS